MTLQDLSHASVEAAHLMARYTRAADTVDFDALAPLFADDVVMSIGGETITGKEAVVAWYRAAIDPNGWSQHLLGNQLVESFDAENVSFATYFQATSVSEAGPQVTLGEYRIAATVVDGALRITRNDITVAQSYAVAVRA